MPGRRCRAGGAPRRPSACTGFTLLELIVALAVVGLLLAVVPAGVSRLHDTMAYRSAVADVLATLKLARAQALSTGLPVGFTLDTVSREYSIDGRHGGTLPEELEVGLIVAQSESNAEKGTIRFYPGGGSTGGSVLLQRASGGGVRLRVDWLLGRITQEQP